MEVVVIDKATFERMLSGFEIFAEKVERLCREQEDLGEKEWLDSDDVCRLLCISPRTLQTMRENGTLAYTKISHKVYYRPEDVKAVFPVAEMKRCITAGKERICNVTNKQTSQPTNQPTNRYLTYELQWQHPAADTRKRHARESLPLVAGRTIGKGGENT